MPTSVLPDVYTILAIHACTDVLLARSGMQHDCKAAL
jgi:hypothetical protein